MESEEKDDNNCYPYQIFNKRNSYLYHPLKPNYIFFILVVLLITFFTLVYAYYFFQSINDVLQRIIEFASGIFATTTIAILIFYFTQEEIKRLDYAEALKKMLEEICENKVKFDEFSINVNLRIKQLEEEKKWNWIIKLDSYTNWASGHNFQYKYFATNAYFNFVNQGFILNEKYLKIPKGNIANIYELFHDFNFKLQINENCINEINPELIDQSEFIKNIRHYLVTDFYNKYAEGHLNGGFYLNYKEIYDGLHDYYNFEAEIEKFQVKYDQLRKNNEERRK